LRKKRRFVTIFLLLFLCALLQATTLNHFLVFHTKPDLLLLFVVMIGLFNSVEEGVLFGLIAGIMSSFLSAAYPWSLSLAYGLPGLMAGIIRGRVHPDHYIIPLLTAAGGSLLSSIILIAAAGMQGMEIFTHQILFHLFIFILLNMVFAVPVAFLARSGMVTSRRSME